jgi:predicted nucleic acid-binding protein
MNVFIDSNIFLSFYHLSNEKLDVLESALGLQEAKQVQLWLTSQVLDEVERNREAKIANALQVFEQEHVNKQVPQMARDHPNFAELDAKAKAFAQAKDQLLQALRADATARRLRADAVIGKAFEKAKIIPVTAEIVARAKLRYDRGNPPGKANSYGDAIHWECLLEAVPKGDHLYLISDDQDYRSPLDENQPSGFLKREWAQRKGAGLHLFRRMSKFIAQHTQHAEALANEEKNASIQALRSSPNFAVSHAVIADLNSFPHFTDEQALAIAEACLSNNQVSWIIGDADVRAFMSRILADYGTKLPEETRVRLASLLAHAPE